LIFFRIKSAYALKESIMNHVKSNGTALITGASSGIGAVYAERLARRGHDLLLVARNRERLEGLAATLSKDTGRRVEVLAADLARTSEVKRVAEVLQSRSDISLLVNNAGVGAGSPLLEADIDAMEAMIALNTTAVTRLAYAAGRAFVKRGGGTIINIASIVAVAPELLNGVYGATKAYVLALSQSMRHELESKGVKVQVVLPGAIATDFWRVSGVPIEVLPTEMVMSTEDLVDAALAGLELGEFVTVPSLPEAADWDRLENARQALRPNLSRNAPAARYQVAGNGVHH
jgi:short-subunit dehydrogenase